MSTNERKWGVVLSYVGQGIKIIVCLVYTPIMLRILGQSEYGLYQLVYSVVSYLSLLSFGFGSSYMRFYSKAKVEDEKNGISKLNGMFMLIFGILSLLCVLGGVIMTKNIRGILGNKITETEYASARILMILMVFSMAISLLNSVFNCYITSQEKFVFQKGIIIVENLFSPFLALPLLIMGYGSVGMVFSTTVLTTSIFLINIFFCLKRLKMSFAFRGLKFSLLKEMWIFTFFIFLNQVIDQINWSIDKFLLGRILGTYAVAIYGIGGQINSLYLQFSTSISYVYIPKVNSIVAETNDNNQLTQLFVKVGRIQFMVIMLILSGFIVFGKAFIALWAGDKYIEAYWVALILIVAITIPLTQNLGIEILRAKNKHKTRSVVLFCVSIANVAISIPLIKCFGTAGAALGTAISLLVGNILFMNWYYHYEIGIDIICFWINILKMLPALILPSIMGVAIMLTIKIISWSVLLVVILLYTVVFCVSFCILGTNKEEKDQIRKIIVKITPK